MPLLACRMENNIITSDFIRMPKRGGRCPITGLSRSSIHNLITSGAVESYCLRNRPGQVKGPILLSVESLRAFVLRNRVTPNPIEA
jgi:hypothetical protein